MKTILLPAILALSLFTSSCAMNKKKTDSAAGTNTTGSVNDAGLTLEMNGDSDSMKAGGLSTIFFALDSSTLDSSSKATLASNAAFLKANEAVAIQIEGHCDERGGIQYNLALGERRAKTVKDYFVASGIASSRLTTVSYGKERPLEVGHDESAWSKNRRANFVVTAK